MLTVGIVLLALQILAAGSPSPVDRDNDGIRISLSKRRDVVSDSVADIEALINALLNVRRKYENTIEAYKRNTGLEPPISLGVPVNPPANTTSGSKKRATGTVPLTNQANVLWQGTISVGTPPLPYTVDFDTGSSDLFLPGTSCTKNCAGHSRYSPLLSTTSKDRKKTFKLEYQDGSTVSGKQYSDTVSAGGLTATGQALGAASTYSDSLAIQRFTPDGLLGMGYQVISQYNSPPFFQTLVAQKKTTKPMFAFKLATTGSELYLGGVNPDLYTGSFTYVPVTTKAYWQVKMDSVTVINTGPKRPTPLPRIEAIIDTGTTLIIGDAKNVKSFYAQIPGAKDAAKTVALGYYTVPCDAVPTVQLTFGRKAFEIPPEAFNLGRVDGASEDCVAGIVSSGTSQSFWIVGDVFLRGVYTSFDLGANRVGFAELKQ